MNMTPVPRIAAIHDLSGFGRTSLTVAIPVLSSMGMQVCPLPTALLSTHTVDFTDYTLLDLTGEMRSMLTHWERLKLRFEAVYSGFMATPEQMDLVARCVDSCRCDGGLAVIDPVLGDNGVLDPTMSVAMVERMRWLIRHADVITPNSTEAAFLLNEPCQTAFSADTIKEWLLRLADMGPRCVVITSVPCADRQEFHLQPADTAVNAHLSVVVYEADKKAFWRIDCPSVAAHYPGTGDTFASVLTGCLLQGDSLPVAADRAAQFATLCIQISYGYGLPSREGVLLERALPALREPYVRSLYRPL